MRMIAAGVLFLAAAAVTAGADETLLCRQWITTVPAVISTPGHYCLGGNISSALGTGTAVIIRSDNVVFDLNGFTLDNSAAGLGTEADGIDGFNLRDVTVRNGTVKGFMFGVDLETTARGANYTVEGIHSVGNTVAGIFLPFFQGPGGGHVVRNNVVVDTGGSTAFGSGAAFGIVIGGGGHVSGNEVIHTFATGAAIAIDIREGTVIAAGNRVSTAKTGVQCLTGNAVLRDNVVAGAGTPYTSACTMVGTTNYP